MHNIKINLKDCIIPMYYEVLKDVLSHGHTHYTFKGGRGSTKSSFVGGICIPLLIVDNPDCHAVVFRKIANTIQKTTRSQVEWGIHQLRLDEMFIIPKRYDNPIIFKPTGQQIIFMGLDDPQKVRWCRKGVDI